MKNSVKTLEGLKKYRFLILAAVLGFLLLLIPSNGKDDTSGTSEEARLEQILEDTDGVGEASVLLSENGAVIVCEGADMADTRLVVMKAAGAFTGFSSDKIQIFKLDMED